METQKQETKSKSKEQTIVKDWSPIINEKKKTNKYDKNKLIDYIRPKKGPITKNSIWKNYLCSNFLSLKFSSYKYHVIIKTGKVNQKFTLRLRFPNLHLLPIKKGCIIWKVFKC